MATKNGDMSDKSAPAAKSGDGVEGEGSYTGTKQYNDSTKNFIASGKVQKAADEAVKSVEGPEAADLRKAEAEGKSHSHGEDPALKKR